MVQLIIDGIYLPETTRDKYSCYPEQLGECVEMISGRQVVEIRGNVQKISYSYDYMGNDLCRQLLAVLRSGRSFQAFYLPDDWNEMISSQFICESLSNPTFAWSKSGVPYWHNVSFTLREVKPHD